MGYAENWPESYQPVNCLTFSLQLFFGPRNRRSSSRRKDKKQKAQKRKGKCRARATEKERERKANHANMPRLSFWSRQRTATIHRKREREGVQGKREWGPMGSVIKCLQFYFSSFALSNLNDKWRRHRLQTSEGTGKRVQHASACPATLTLALTFCCCLSREHVITLSRVQTAREREKTSEMREKNKDNAYRGSWQTLPSNLDRHLSSPVPHSPFSTPLPHQFTVIRVRARQGMNLKINAAH